MSKIQELGAALETRGVPIPAIQRHLATLRLIADLMKTGPSSIDQGEMNFSLTFSTPNGERPHRQLRFTFSKRTGQSTLYSYRFLGNGQSNGVHDGLVPDAEITRQKFTWLYEKAIAALDA